MDQSIRGRAEAEPVKFCKRKFRGEVLAECGNRLLLGNAMERPGAVDQIRTIDGDRFAIRKQALNDAKCECVGAAPKCGDKHDLVANVEIHITARQSPLLAANHIVTGRRHRKLNDFQELSALIARSP